MSTCTLMAYSPSQPVLPLNQDTIWQSNSPEHFSLSSNTTQHRQRAYSSEPHSHNSQEFKGLDETKKELREGRGVGIMPTQSSPALISQNAPDSVIFSHPRKQTGEEVPRSEIPDSSMHVAARSESTQKLEQTQTMLDPESNYTLHPPLPATHTPPKSISSFALFDRQTLEKDVFIDSPLSLGPSDAPPHYFLKNPNTMLQTPEIGDLKPLNTMFLNANGTIASAHHSFFNTQWAQIQKRRTDNMGLRSQIRDMRRRLREKQNVKSITEDRFFQRVRKKEMRGQERGVGQEDELMLHLMQEYQIARDAYGPLEDDCNQLEDKLYADEFALHQLENEFYQMWTIVPDTSSPRPPSSPHADAPPTPETDSFEEAVHMSYHPMVEKYLSKQGDLDLLFERLDEIYDERENLDEQRETRAALGLNLGQEEEAWLEKSEDLLAEIELKIEAMEAEVSDLKEQCLAQNLIDVDGDPIDMLALEKSAFHKEEGLDAKSELSEYSKYPKILQQPLVKEDEGSDYLPDLGEESYTLGARINKWMLDRLRSSALEVNLLARTYEDKGKGKESSDVWQISVLRLWYEDGTIAFEAHTSTLRSGGSGRSDALMQPSEIANTVRNSVLRIKIASSLPIAHQAKIEAETEEGNEEAGRLARPPGVIGGFSSHSQ